MLMTLKELKYMVYSDLYRYCGNVSTLCFVKSLLLEIGFKCSFWMRVCGYFERKSRIWLVVYLLSRVMHRRCIVRYGISVPHMAEIGPGFYVGHFGNIVVNSRVRIGRNLNISQGVTIGVSNRGERAGVPEIGDNVYIGPGAKIFGKVRIGNGVAIGANCVVTKDVPDRAVVVGVPGRVISHEGSDAYINRTDYDPLLRRKGLCWPGDKYGLEATKDVTLPGCTESGIP